MKIVWKNPNELFEYENHVRISNEDVIEVVMQSIKEFGFKQPVVVDENNVIVVGRVRRIAAIRLGLDKIPCLVADDLTDEQIKAYRLVDNRSAELSSWDYKKLDLELREIELDLREFGFDKIEIDWDSVPDLTSDSYEEPEDKQLKCPQCGAVDRAVHFKKVE